MRAIVANARPKTSKNSRPNDVASRRRGQAKIRIKTTATGAISRGMSQVIAACYQAWLPMLRLTR